LIKKENKIKEPSIIIRPIGRLGGLDNLHITLIIVIVLLFLIVLVTSYSKPILIINSSNSSNVSVYAPEHSAAQIKILVERLLASYATVNTSLSLLPFVSNVAAMNATYLNASKSWYVHLTASNPESNITFAVAFLVNDLNITKVTPLLQAAIPSQIGNNTVVAQGVVKLGGKYACLSRSPMQVYWFMDPYASGAVRSLLNATSLEASLGNMINLTVKIRFGSDTQNIASSFGLFNAQYLGKYVFCASQQKNFSSFASNLNSLYSGSYVSQGTLSKIANVSKLDFPELSSCINASSQTLNAQSLLAQYYNITQTPIVVVDCHYMALPQTAHEALCYAENSLC
jgi:hypothetical protein